MVEGCQRRGRLPAAAVDERVVLLLQPLEPLLLGCDPALQTGHLRGRRRLTGAERRFETGDPRRQCGLQGDGLRLHFRNLNLQRDLPFLRIREACRQGSLPGGSLRHQRGTLGVCGSLTGAGLRL